METVKIARRLGAAVETGGMKVIFLEQTAIQVECHEEGFRAAAALDPVGALALTPGGAGFYGIDGRRFSPDVVRLIYPELAAQIAEQYPEFFAVEGA